MKKSLLCLIALLAANCFATVTVTVPSPAANSTVSSTFTFQASASSSTPIVGWHAYLDSQNVFTAGVTGSVSGTLTAAPGNHQLVIRAWDSTGAYGDQWINISVSGTPAPTPTPAPGTGLPTPPATAKVFSNIDNINTGWVPCGNPACAGGSGAGNYWQAFFQSNPSMDGSSMELYRDGVWANALWHHKQGAINSATNFLWDFYFMVDTESLSHGQAFEYDVFQFVGGWNYMIGTECDYGHAVWDTWNESTGHWLHTTIPCPKFTPGTWHHIQWYMTTDHTNHTYTYKTFVIDGKVYNVNQTQPAKWLNWGDNLGAQYQLGVNATGGGFHEWIDKERLTVW